jgi:hypothetical protein
VTLPASGPWSLPVEGFEVLYIGFGFAIDITAHGHAGLTVNIKLESAFELREPGGGTHRLDPSTQSWEELAQIMSLRHDRIHSATATENAHLRIEFDNGRILEARADPQYESWAISGQASNSSPHPVLAASPSSVPAANTHHSLLIPFPTGTPLGGKSSG